LKSHPEIRHRADQKEQPNKSTEEESKGLGNFYRENGTDFK
jgi:hypothetical protein